MTCPECGGTVRLALTGYYCTDCRVSWEHIVPENRRENA